MKSFVDIYVSYPTVKQAVHRSPTLEPGCLEAIAIASRAAGPRAVVPTSDNLSAGEKGDVTIRNY